MSILEGMMIGGNGVENAFWICAIGGTVFFALRLLMMIIGGVDHGVEVGDHAHDVMHHGDVGSDAAFKLLSFSSLTGFFMMFGWVGLACYKQFDLGQGLSILGALVAGLAAMYLTASLFRAAQLLVSSGSQFKLESAVGQKATVYQRIPSTGKGRIQLALNGQTFEIDAVAENLREILSQATVEVVRVVDGTTVSVKRSE